MTSGAPLGFIAAAVVALPARAFAHGFGERYDLPVPLGFWLVGAAAAVVLSFVLFGLFIRWTPDAARYPHVNLRRWWIGRALSSRYARRVGQLVAVSLLVLIVAAALIGDQNPTRNLAPTAIWVVWWVGVAYFSALVGNIWSAINPWAALFSGYEALRPRWPNVLPAPLRMDWPPWLGVWPAMALFAVFAWIELVFDGRSIPWQLGILSVAYSAITWAGMFVFGRAAWLQNGDPFTVAFGILARFAPTTIRERDNEWNLRPFGIGLLRADDVTPSLIVFVLLLLSTVTFDGFTATPIWARIENALYVALPAFRGARLTIIGTAGLAFFAIAFVLVYRLFVRLIAAAGGGEIGPAATARLFVLSLVPIAIAYHLAHYFTYLLIQGQLIIRLASDPFGFGWNLFGTARYRPDIGIIGPRSVWYVAVIAIILGHVIAVCVAHMVALREYSSRRTALRSQFPMLVLMVAYTMLSLWIIAQPIVETRPDATLTLERAIVWAVNSKETCA